jgi:MFS family permease
MVYAVLVASAFLIEIALNVPLGSLPLALIHDHVPPGEIALIVGAGPIAALAVSVPIGGLADRFGRLRTMRIAAVLCVISVGALAFVTDPILNGALMAIRGVAITAFVTAEYAYVSAIVASDRAVSQTATLGMVGNLSFATAPAAGFWLWQHGLERQQYLAAAGCALLGALILVLLPAERGRRIRRSRKIFMRSAWIPAIAFLVACTLAGGVNGALAIVTFHQRGIGNGALLFTAMAFTTFGLRFFAGRLVDRFGPRMVAIPTAIVQCLGSLLAAHAQTPPEVIVAGACAGIAWSAVVPVGIGLLFERSSRGTRGAAMGSYNLAFSIGATAGSLIAAGAAACGLGYTFAMSLCALASVLVLPWVLLSRPHRSVRGAVVRLAAQRA